MMWRKAWWECRNRVFLCAVVTVMYSLGGAFALIDLKGTAMAMDWFAKFVAVFGALMAVTLAGSGINSQSSSGTVQGFHPSLYFLLSLPVSRRYAMLVRSTTGLLFSLFFVAACVGLFGLAAPLRGLHISLHWAFSVAAFSSVGGFAAFGMTTFLMTILDELTAGMFSIGSLLGAFGAWAVLDWSKVLLDPMAILDGQQFIHTGHVFWPLLILLMAVGIAFLWAALYVVERKEY
jgi:hypothetical protein